MARYDLELTLAISPRGDMRGVNRSIRAPFSERLYNVKYRGASVDIFCVLPPAQWGVILTIRTGSWEFSKWLVQQGWPRGIKFENGEMLQGFLLGFQRPPVPLAIDPKTREWIATPELINHSPIPEEKDVFEFLKIPFVEPRDRCVDPATGKMRWMQIVEA